MTQMGKSSSSKPGTTGNSNKVPVFSSFNLGGMKLPNRIVCSALSRGRADPMTGNPTDLHAEYYAARSSSAFMFTESSPISLEGNLGGAAGLFTDE